EVWSGCRLSTRRPHRWQRPWWLRYLVTCGRADGMSTTYCSSVPCSSTSPPQNGQPLSGTSTLASTRSGTGRCAGGCSGFRPGFFGSLLRFRRRNGAACLLPARCASSRRRFRSLFSSTSRAFSSFSASFSTRSRAHSDRSIRFSPRRARIGSSTSEARMLPARGGLPARTGNLATASHHLAYRRSRAKRHGKHVPPPVWSKPTKLQRTSPFATSVPTRRRATSAPPSPSCRPAGAALSLNLGDDLERLSEEAALPGVHSGHPQADGGGDVRRRALVEEEHLEDREAER